ncbi:MAG: helix-turn-helix transcriptional regulator [Lachnospiraceae bacterium]|nr:helix-turn-helix transcriptional regulator [Lachnospiraceae bacterium]
MNMLKQINAAIEYIEANLCAGFDLDTAAGIACVTADSFIRFFSYMTGMKRLPRKLLALTSISKEFCGRPNYYIKYF